MRRTSKHINIYSPNVGKFCSRLHKKNKLGLWKFRHLKKKQNIFSIRLINKNIFFFITTTRIIKTQTVLQTNFLCICSIFLIILFFIREKYKRRNAGKEKIKNFGILLIQLIVVFYHSRTLRRIPQLIRTNTTVLITNSEKLLNSRYYLLHLFVRWLEWQTFLSLEIFPLPNLWYIILIDKMNHNFNVYLLFLILMYFIYKHIYNLLTSL